MTPQNEGAAEREAVIQRLESLRRAGVTHLPRRAPPPSPSLQEPTELSRSSAKSMPSAELQEQSASLFEDDSVSRAPALSLEQRCAALEALSQRVAGCTRCGELAASRTQTVFGVGSPQARLCFLGEAPGADEDRQGEPFVGKAGRLLNDIIKACGLKREEVYILNILKCRPPGNRNPASEEAANCEEYLHEQLDVIQPEWICCLGAVAATNLLKTTTSIGKLRGKIHQYRGINVVATYHPAYLLRNPAAKKDTWADMQMLMREMGIQIPDWKKR